MSSPIAQIKSAESSLIAQIHAAASLLEDVATGSLSHALTRLTAAREAAQARLQSAAVQFLGEVSDLAAFVEGLVGSDVAGVVAFETPADPVREPAMAAGASVIGSAESETTAPLNLPEPAVWNPSGLDDVAPDPYYATPANRGVNDSRNARPATVVEEPEPELTSEPTRNGRRAKRRGK